MLGQGKCFVSHPERPGDFVQLPLAELKLLLKVDGLHLLEYATRRIRMAFRNGHVEGGYMKARKGGSALSF